jgi:threonine/homoserine efflux transporter RhtA
MEAAHVTAVLAAPKQGTAARDATAIGHALAHGLGWLWHAYVTVVTAFAHHQVPPTAQTAAFAATFAAVVLFMFRRRKRSASA